MRFELLGLLRVRAEGADLDLGGPRQQRVLAVLLANTPDLVSVDRLIDEVWPGEPPATAAHVISTYVSNLRGVVGDRLVSEGNRYGVDVSGDTVDAVELTEGLRQGRKLLGIDPGAAFDLLDMVVQVWRGQPFEGIGDDAVSLRVRATELNETHLQTVETRIEAGLRLGRHDSLVPELVGLTGKYPFRERLTAQLMLALYRSGRQAEALRAYGDLRRRLGDELGIDPGPDVQQLEERILLQDPGLALQPPHNIPTPVTSFVGRRVELGETTKQVQAYRMVTLLGVGGVGKTRLAIEAGTELLENFPDGVWWIDLAPIGDPSLVGVRIAEVLGVSAQPGVALPDVLARYLSARETLLVLDNCEHVLEAAGTLAAKLLGGAPGLKILATSRRPLGVVGEVRYRVPPLNLPRSEAALDYAASDAERLFVARAQDAAPGLSIGPEEATTLARICLNLEGLPLAIEMAAARAGVLSLRQIAEHLAEDRGLLAATEVDRADRQRTIEALVAWSFTLLGEQEQVAFARLSVFADSFALDAAAAVIGFDPIESDEVLDTVTGLVDASMLVAEPGGDGGTRFRMLAALRGFARSRLEESGETDGVRARHSKFHLDLAVRAGQHRTTPEFAPWMGRLEAVRDELAPALDWSLDNESRTVSMRSIPGLLEYWQRRGDADPAYRYGLRMLDGADDAPAELRAYALMSASFGAALTGDFSLAAQGPQQALDIAGGVSSWKCRLWAMLTRGQIGTILGDLPGVEAMGRKILELCDEHDLTLPRAYGQSLLAEAEFFSDGDYAVARRLAGEAIQGFRELHDIGGLKIYGLSIAAPAAALQGDFDAAEEYATEAIALPGLAWTAAAYVILGGYVLIPRGDPDRAKHVLDRGIRIAYETSNEIWMRFGLLFLASLAARDEAWEGAARLFGACRPNLPAWGHQSRWWTEEPRVREALGGARFERLASDGATAPPRVIMEWIDGAGVAPGDPNRGR